MATVNIETQLTNRINELKKKVLVEAEQKLKFERNAQGTLITTESPRDFKKDVEWLAQKEGMSQKNVDAYKADALKRKSSMFKNIDESILDLIDQAGKGLISTTDQQAQTRILQEQKKQIDEEYNAALKAVEAVKVIAEKADKGGHSRGNEYAKIQDYENKKAEALLKKVREIESFDYKGDEESKYAAVASLDNAIERAYGEIGNHLTKRTRAIQAAEKKVASASVSRSSTSASASKLLARRKEAEKKAKTLKDAYSSYESVEKAAKAFRKGKFALDTETSGLLDVLEARPVTFGLGGYTEKGKVVKQSYFLDYGSKEKTLKNLVDAMNVPDKNTGGLFKSAQELRSQFGVSKEGALTQADLDKVWKTVEKSLVNPDQLLKIMKQYGIEEQNLFAFNGGFDNEMLLRWLNDRKGELSAKTKTALTKLFKAAGKNDVREKYAQAMASKNAHGDIKEGDILIRAKSSDPKSQVKGSGTLQRAVSILKGEEAEESHEAGSDALNTIDVLATLEVSNVYEAARDIVEDEIEAKKKSRHKTKGSNGIHYLDTVTQSAVNSALEQAKGLGNEHFNSSELVSKMKGDSDRKTKIDQVIGLFDKSYQKSMLGYELRERFEKRAGLDVSAITGAGENTTGTTIGALLDFDKAAAEKGYDVVYRKLGEDTIQAMLVPNEDFDETYTYGDADFDASENKVEFRMADEMGRIARKINNAKIGTEFFEDAQGNIKAQTVLVTAETQAIKNATKFLNSETWNDPNRTEKELFGIMQSRANSAVNQTSSTAFGSEGADDDMDSMREYSGALTEIEAIRSTGVSYQDEIKSFLRRTKTQQAFARWAKKAYGGEADWMGSYDALNPEQSKNIWNGMVNAYRIAMRGINSEKVEAMPANDITRFILEDEEFKPLLARARKVGEVLPIDETALSEGRAALGKFQVTSSRNYTPLGILSDFSQRSLSQFYNNMALTKKGAKARNKIGFSSLLTTEDATSAGLNRDDPTRKLFETLMVSQEEYNKAQRSYYAKKLYGRKWEDINALAGSNDEAVRKEAEAQLQKIDENLRDLEDSVVMSEQMKKGLQSTQKKTYSAPSKSIDKAFLSQIGVDISNFDKAEIGDKVSLDYTLSRKSDRLAFAEGEENVLERGDHVVGLEKTAEGWKLVVEKLRDIAQGSKTATDTGNRMIVQGDEEYSQAIIQSLADMKGVDASSIQAVMLDKDKMEERNFANYYKGTLEEIIHKAQESGKSVQEIYDALTKSMPLFSKIAKITKGSKGKQRIQLGLSYDSKEGQFKDINGNVVLNDTEENKKLLLGLQDFADAIGYKGKVGDVRALGFVQHDVYPYEDPYGYADTATLERDARVNDDEKARMAREASRARAKEAVLSKMSGQKKEEMARGLDSLIEQEKADAENYGPKALEAQQKIAEIQDAWQTLKEREAYVTKRGTKDIEFVTRASLGGKDAAENQIVIDDAQTELKELTNGKATEADYNNFIMQKARLLKESLIAKGGDDAEKYKKGNFVANASNIKGIGKKYMLADIAGTLSPEGGYMPSKLDKTNGLLLKAMMEGAEAFKEASIRTQNVYSATEKDKHGELRDAAKRVYRPYSSFVVAESGAMGTNLTDEQANTMYMSANRARKMFSSRASTKKADIAQNIKNLQQLYKTHSKDAYNNMSAYDKSYLDMDEKAVSTLTKDELIDLERVIVDAIVKDIEKGNNTYTGSADRYPFTQGYEGGLTRIGIRSGIGDKVVQFSQGLLRDRRGDTDGDKLRIMANVRKKFGDDEFAAEQAMLKFYDKRAGIMEKYAQRKATLQAGDEGEKQKSLEEIAERLTQRMINEEASAEAKTAFQNVGSFSNSATNIRKTLKTIGYGADLNTTQGKIQAFKGDMIKAFLEKIEQDAISSKKIYARLMEANGMTEDEAYLQVSQLTDLLRKGKIGDSGKQKGFLTRAKELGIFKKDKDTDKFYLDDKQFESMISGWMASDEDFVKKNFGSLMREKDGLYTGFDLDAIEGYFNDMARYQLSQKKRKKGPNTVRGMLAAMFAGRLLPKEGKSTWYQQVNAETDEVGQNNKVAKEHAEIWARAAAAEGDKAKVSEILTSQLKEETSAIEESTDAVEEHEKAFLEAGATLEDYLKKVKLVNTTSIAPENIDYDEAHHIYTNKLTGNRMLSTTQLSSLLTGPVDNETIERQKYLMQQAEAKYSHGGVLTAADVGLEEESFRRLALGATGDSAGNILHALIDMMAKSGMTPAQLLENNAWKNIYENQVKTSPEMAGDFARLASVGLGDADIKVEERITNYLKAMDQASLAFSDLSETILGMTMEMDVDGQKRTIDVAGRIDQLLFDTLGNPALMDNKTFNITGKQGLQLGLQKLLLSSAAKARNLDQFGLTPEQIEKVGQGDFTTAIAQLNKNGVVELKNIIPLLNDTIASLVAMASDNFTQGRQNYITQDQEHVMGVVAAGNIAQSGQVPKANNALIKSYISQYKQILKIQEQIDADEKRLASSGMKGERADNIRSVVNMRKRLLGQIQAEVPNLDLEKGELNGQKLSEEELIKLKKEIALLDSNHGIQLEKNNALQKQSVGLVQQIANGFKASFRNLTDYSLAYAVIGKIRMAYSQLINYAEQLNASMVDLQIASGLSYSNIKNMMLDFNDIAVKVGKSTLEVSQAANDWLRAGYEGQDAATLVENSMQLSTLGMINSAEATEYLISMLKGWKLEVKEVGSIVDKLVAVDMSAAISARDLATALARANTSAQLAGKICA